MFTDPLNDGPHSLHQSASPVCQGASSREKLASPSASIGADINLASVDLNLLVALEALLQLRNVTHAGKRVGLSQPAMSRALARLRALFKDDLLVRTPRGLTLTIRGEQLLDRLPDALGLLRTLVSGRDVAELQSKRRVTVAMAEHQALVLLPQLLPRFLQKEPDLDLVVQGDLTQAERGLEDGSIDFMVGPRQEASSGFYGRTLYTDRMTCLLRHDHPALDNSWSRENFQELRPAVLAGTDAQVLPHLCDGIFNTIKLERIPLVISNLSLVPTMVANTDLALVLPSRAANLVAANSSLVLKELPGKIQETEVALLWHERCHRDPRHRWMRSEFAAAAGVI
ncbi:LysR family transcriptional regulator [Pararhizobium arenae]|uniref:LysR family transcriptional regulator n=1 Tax=Pararhizobium arenae TaxID=1856850 RepID=UPI0009FA9376|nr:LysR family transcriptional regulator [Pararhizobium arenae]